MELSGGILLKLREGLDLTRAQIAERIEGSAEAWYRWEKGLSRPSKFYRQQLRKTFGKELRALGVDIPFYESTTGYDDTG